MSGKNRKENLATAIRFNAILTMLLLFGMTVFAQTDTPATNRQNANEKSATQISQPVLTSYKDIKIGTTADEARNKLGKPKIDDKDGFYYEISDGEFAQIRLDKDNKIRLIAVTYTGENAPKFEDVFGKDASVEPSADGRIYKLVRYPQAGYWVAYSRTAGEKPSVTVTMQKMRNVK